MQVIREELQQVNKKLDKLEPVIYMSQYAYMALYETRSESNRSNASRRNAAAYYGAEEAGRHWEGGGDPSEQWRCAWWRDLQFRKAFCSSACVASSTKLCAFADPVLLVVLCR